MDALSEKGLQVRTEVEEVISRLEAAWKAKFIQWKNSDPISFDGFIVEDGEIGGIFEFKSRNVSFKDDKIEYKGKWYDTVILSQSKIDECVEFSQKYRVPFVFVFYAQKSASVHVIQITNSKGDYLFPYKTEKTKTQATINGGRATRLNAFLPLDKSKQWL